MDRPNSGNVVGAVMMADEGDEAAGRSSAMTFVLERRNGSLKELGSSLAALFCLDWQREVIGSSRRSK